MPTHFVLLEHLFSVFVHCLAQYSLTWVICKQNDFDDIASEKLEESRAAYRAAVAAAKENPTEELLAKAAEARLQLQALLI